MRSRWRGALAGLLAAGSIVGCGPAIPEEELGTVYFEVPQVPGAEEPYPLPEVPPERAGAPAQDESEPARDLPPESQPE